jgi:hypothetical protein
VNTQVLESWLPVPEASGEWSLETVSNASDGLGISLTRGASSGERLVLQFEWVPAYRFSPNHIYDYSPEGGSLRIAVNSQYLEWLRETTRGVYDQPYRHFVILTVDGTIDVLSLEDPNVKVESRSA